MDFESFSIKNFFNYIPNTLNRLFCNINHPWQAIPHINSFIESTIERIDINQYYELSDGIWIGKDTKIADESTIIPPAIIGSECEIRPGAFIRGNVFTGNRCVIGNSTEIKNSILFDNVQLPHFNYVGDSVLGNHSHLGAGAVCSNQKQDKSDIYIKGTEIIDTGLKKLGAIIADNVEIGSNCVINPGTIVLKNTRIYPLNSVRGIIPSNCIYKASDNIIPII